MKQVLMFVAVLSVFALASCKKKTCKDSDGYVWCSDCTKTQVKLYETYGDVKCEK